MSYGCIGNYHEPNVDWLICQMRKYFDKTDELEKLVTDFVNSANIPELINDAVDKKIDSMDKYFQTLVNDTITALYENKIVKFYKSVSEMKTDKNELGTLCITAGYSAPYDGGAAMYLCTNNAANEMDNISGGEVTYTYVSSGMCNLKSIGASSNRSDNEKVINYAGRRYSTIFLPNDKYTISNSIIIDNSTSLDGGGSTIVPINQFTSDSLVYIRRRATTYEEALKNVVLKNLTLDGNNVANMGIVEGGVVGGKIENVIIINTKIYGLYLGWNYSSGLVNAEITIDNVRIENIINNAGSAGILAQSPDLYFNNIIMVDCYNAIVDQKANVWNNVHAWIKSSGKVQGSLFLSATDMSILNNCVCDTYQYGARIDGDTVITLNNFIYVVNTIVYNNAILQSSPPILFVHSGTGFYYYFLVNSGRLVIPANFNAKIVDGFFQKDQFINVIIGGGGAWDMQGFHPYSQFAGLQTVSSGSLENVGPGTYYLDYRNTYTDTPPSWAAGNSGLIEVHDGGNTEVRHQIVTWVMEGTTHRYERFINYVNSTKGGWIGE